MSSKTVVNTGKHVELAMQAADACISSMLVGPFTWSSRKVSIPRSGKGSFTQDSNGAMYPLVADVEIEGMIGERRVWARVFLHGYEDLSGPGSVHRPDDVSGPQFLAVDLVRIRLHEVGSDKVRRRAFEIDDMPSIPSKPMKMPEAVI